MLKDSSSTAARASAPHDSVRRSRWAAACTTSPGASRLHPVARWASLAAVSFIDGFWVGMSAGPVVHQAALRCSTTMTLANRKKAIIDM